MAKKKTSSKSFWNPDKNGFVRGSIGGYGYAVQSNKNSEVKKRENKITAQFMNNQSIDFTNSVWYSPELTPDMWLMPKSRLETLRWTRLFFNMDPYIYSIIMMHSQYPFSKFKIIAQDPDVTRFYEQNAFNRKFNLYDFILKMSLSYNKFGEAITMSVDEEVNEGDVSLTKWKKFILFEPEFIEIRQAFFEEEPRYYLQVTDDMKKDIQEAMNLGREVGYSEEMLKYDEILLDNSQMSAIINETDASAERGTSPVQSLLRALLYQDKVNMLKLTAIDRFRYPVEIWKIGDLERGIKPNEAQLKQFEQYVKTAKDNPPFSLFVPPFVNYEVVGYGNEKTIFDYMEDYEWTRDAIMVGLGVNKNLILGDGPSMSNVKDLALMKLFMIYKTVQDRFTYWMQNHFFYPLAEKNSFVKEDGELDIPEIHWEKEINLDRDETEDYIDLWEKGVISTKTLFSKYKGVDYENEEQGLKDEVGTVYDDGKRIRNRDIKPEKPEEPGAGGGPLPEGPEEGPEAPLPEGPEEEVAPAEETEEGGPVEEV